jgi:hypothetical protein
VFSGELRVRMSVPAWPAPNRAGYRRRVLERWGHSNVQCSSSCNALGARHQGHALRDYSGPSVTQPDVQCPGGASLCATCAQSLIRLMSWLYGMLVRPEYKTAGLQCECE